MEAAAGVGRGPFLGFDVATVPLGEGSRDLGEVNEEGPLLGDALATTPLALSLAVVPDAEGGRLAGGGMRLVPLVEEPGVGSLRPFPGVAPP